ncbi:hypothetical protein GCM10017044_07920 [Kordiimonas sediminis]|uniref:RNA polymerase sigma factor n=1 Tax=Kordiimonas sediminis TaxID=1735581 RepID=A0A919E5W8_9PROT|nr:sigma-70 family RNA polymerase sigma factor [Kordiimonas sediminis]GHF16065.1 hypothetical protein GCM10017044_07920 [Kordiimonas sediminis]
MPKGVFAGDDSVRRVEEAAKENRSVLYAWLRRKIGDPEQAEDIVQQVFVRALGYAKTNHVENARALLFKIAANLAVNEFRRKSREARHIVHLDQDDQPISEMGATDTTPEGELENKQRLSELKATIDRMPERQRKAFVMNRFEGKTYQEIAEVFGVSVSTIEKDFIGALRKLREASKEETGNVVPLNARRRKKKRC